MISLIIYCFLVYLLAGVGTSVGYHRILTHKSATLPRWLEYTIVVIALPAGTPIQWVGNHRAHHKYEDTERDPHSPIIQGFWYAHCGWYLSTKNQLLSFLYALGGPLRMILDSFLRPRSNQEHNHFAKDVSSVSFYRMISAPLIYNLILLLYLSVLVLFFWFFWKWNGVLALWISLVLIYNLGDAVNSFGHLYGNSKGGSSARNNAVLGWLTFGDGWHANHHKKPNLAKHGIKKSQVDLSFLIISLLRKCKLVDKIQGYEKN
ncbi:MAG: fatty acid desaturase [Fluviicola sp.]|nr:MAG: fatty acid desaturase [Fluviicola sp.]